MFFSGNPIGKKINAASQKNVFNRLVSIYVAGLLVVVGGVQEVMRQIEFGVKLYLLLHVAVAISN
jgi:hypothetical protein